MNQHLCLCLILSALLALGARARTYAGVTIAGTVLDREGKPAPGVTVAPLLAAGPERKTDVQGHFTLTINTGQPRGAKGLLHPIIARDLERNLAATLEFEEDADNVTLPQGGDTNITIRLGERALSQPGASDSKRSKLVGAILGPDGKPAPNVIVSLFPFLAYAQTHTDYQGRFALTAEPIPAGYGVSQRVLIARDLERGLAAALDLEEDATNADLRLSPGLTLAGRVTDANGHAISNAQARLLFRTDRRTSALGQLVRADDEGRFEIKALPPGRHYSVTVFARGFGQDLHDVDTPEAGGRRLELEPFQLLAADQRIAGVVLDADEKPVAAARVAVLGEKQPLLNSRTDSEGRFSVDKVCPGPIRISAFGSADGASGYANAEGGDTNITVRLSSSRGIAMPGAAPAAASLHGKPLPELALLGLAPADAPQGQPLLILLLDAEQRPCRRALRLLTEQAASLKKQGLGVVILQAGAMTDEAFAAWKQETAPPFPVGRFKDPPEKACSAWGATGLPWLILADKSHRVAAEGFALDDLEGQLARLGKDR